MAKKETKAKTSGAKPSGPKGLSPQAQGGAQDAGETRGQASAASRAGRGARAQTSAETERTYASAMDKIRDEMAASKDSKIQLLGEGLTAMLQLHPEWEQAILEKGKNIKGALEAVRKNATGGCSDPIQTTKSLCGYYGIKCENPHVLALEVAVAMMGGGRIPLSAMPAAPIERGDEAAGTSSALRAPSPEGKAGEADPFDLDSILGVL